MKKKYIIANWKMNPAHPEEAKNLLGKIQQKTKESLEAGLEVVICPPSPWLALFNKTKNQIPFSLGAQSAFYKDKGAYTGQVSISMLKNIGADYLLVGHSETRKVDKLTNEEIKKTLNSAFSSGIIPIYFVGEKKKQNRESALQKQLQLLSEFKDKKYLLVYEPLWAISKHEHSRPAQTKEIKAALQFIKNFLKDELKATHIPPFLYGGSTNENNINKFLSLNLLSGVVPGSASLEVESFAEMVKIASNH